MSYSEPCENRGDLLRVICICQQVDMLRLRNVANISVPMKNLQRPEVLLSLYQTFFLVYFYANNSTRLLVPLLEFPLKNDMVAHDLVDLVKFLSHYQI